MPIIKTFISFLFSVSIIALKNEIQQFYGISRKQSAASNHKIMRHNSNVVEEKGKLFG